MRNWEESADSPQENFRSPPNGATKKSPKYVNSPETPIFLKGQLLFNLHLANKEISEERDFLLVEGQLMLFAVGKKVSKPSSHRKEPHLRIPRRICSGNPTRGEWFVFGR